MSSKITVSTTNDRITYRTKGDQPIEPLVDGSEYEVVRVSSDKIKLRFPSSSVLVDLFQTRKGSVHQFEVNEATIVAPLEFTPNIITSPINKIFFDPTAAPPVNTTSNTIRIQDHQFTSNEKVTYIARSGTEIGGLSSGTDYYIKVVDSDNIQLSTDSGLSAVVDLTSAGMGTLHGFERRNRPCLKTINQSVAWRTTNSTS